MHIDTGNTGFMLLCCSLVMLMTPGLAFLVSPRTHSTLRGLMIGGLICNSFTSRRAARFRMG